MSKAKAGGGAAAAPAAEAESENIKVVIRCRPLSEGEVRNGNQAIVTMDRKQREVRVRNPAAPSEVPRTFTMDAVFDESISQAQVFHETCLPIVNNILSGYNGTVFAYGQTGTGKTFSMEGKDGELKGMLPRSFDTIFDHIAATSDSAQFLVQASYLEIYNDNVLDLLAGGKESLELKEDPDKGVYVKDLRRVAVKSVAEINALAVLGRKSRNVGSTFMNAESSRSHSLFCIQIETSEVGADGENHIRAGKLNMVDLAGSERQGKTGAEGVRLKEAAKINLALSALGNVIAALTSSKKVGFVPYRDSKLTRLLQDSLGGNTKTVMIANIGPADYNFEETINTLRFAMRAKSIKNKPKINEDPKDAQLRVFQDEIAALKAALAAEEAIAQGLPPPPGYDPALLARMGMSVGGAGGIPRAALPPRKVIVEKIVERRVGVAAEERDRVLADAEQMRRTLEEKQRRKEEESRQMKDILNQKHTTIKSEVAATENEINAARETKKSMRDRLKEMEDKIAHGAAQIDNAKKQQLAILAAQREIEEAARRQEEAREKKLAIEEEMADFLKHQSEDLSKELSAKSAKLEKLQQKYHEIKQEAEDIQAENQREREQLLETIRELTRHIQLKDFILDNYVPREETEKVENRAYWSEDQDHWLLHPTDYVQLNYGIKRPGSAKAGLRRPTSDFALAQSMRFAQEAQQQGLNGMGGAGANTAAEVGGSAAARYRGENILDLELDLPERTTQDWADGGVVAAQQAASYEQQQANAYELAMQQQMMQQQLAQQQQRQLNQGMMNWQQQYDPQAQQQQQQFRR